MADNADLQSDVLTARQLADRYKVSLRTVADWRYKDTGPDWFDAGGPMYRLEDVVAWDKKKVAEKARARKRAA
jgi:hypothetical protein